MEPKDWVTLGGGLVGVGTLLFGVFQYRIAQKWKRSEFAAKLLEEMAKDSKLVLCTRMLDWGGRDFPVPDEYQSCFPEVKTFRHDWGRLSAAISLESPLPSGGEPLLVAMIYRDVFSHLFDYLTRLNHYVEVDLIDLRDIVELRYWLKEIDSPTYGVNALSPFDRFIAQFDYEGVRRLLAKFGFNRLDTSAAKAVPNPRPDGMA